MYRLAVRNEETIRQTTHYAEIACVAVDAFRNDASPNVLQTVQEALLLGLLEAEAGIQYGNERNKRRRLRWKRTHWSDAAARQRGALHLFEVRRWEALLRDRREVFRQCGDALAWLQLRGDPRQLFPWFATERDHHLTVDEGFGGMLSLLRDAHATGKFLVIAADLTRCIGKGDIVVTRANGDWVRPLIFEVKTHTSRAEIEVFSSQINHPADSGFHKEFGEALHLETGEPRPINRKTARQWDEIADASDTLIRITRGTDRKIPPATRKHWSKIQRLLLRASDGVVFDSPEQGVLYVAWSSRSDVGSPLKKSVAEASHRGVWCSTAKPVQLTTGNVRRVDVLARAVIPIALWDLPLWTRAALLSGELTFATVVDWSIWKTLFHRQGVEFEDHQTAWQLKRGQARAHVDEIELRSITALICFAGVSPEEIVQKLCDSIQE